MKLKTLTVSLLAAFGLVAFATTPALAGEMTKVIVEEEIIIEEPESWWSAELAAGWDSRYMFRGVEILDGGSLAWTDLSFSTYGFTLGAWYATGVNEDFNEIDIYASYAWSLGPVDVEGGYIFYGFPRDGGETQEFFAALSTGVIPYVTPGLAFYYDFDEFEGGWLEFSLSSSLPIVQDVISIDPFAAISYDFEYNSEDSDLNNVQIGVEVPIALSENITLSGYVAYSWALSAIDDFQDDEFWGGAAISFSF